MTHTRLIVRIYRWIVGIIAIPKPVVCSQFVADWQEAVVADWQEFVAWWQDEAASALEAAAYWLSEEASIRELQSVSVLSDCSLCGEHIQSGNHVNHKYK